MEEKHKRLGQRILVFAIGAAITVIIITVHSLLKHS